MLGQDPCWPLSDAFRWLAGTRQSFGRHLAGLLITGMLLLQVTSEALQQIPSMKRLQKLNLKNCSSLTQADAVAIASVPNLQ